MSFVPPKLELSAGPSATLSLGAIMENPAGHWPVEVLTQAVVLRNTGRRQFAFVTKPEMAQRILTDRSGTFVRSRMQNRFFDLSFGRNLLDNRDGLWLDHRRNIARPITPHRVVNHFPAVASACSDLIDRWAAQAEGTAIPLARDSRILAFDALWRALFAVDRARTECDDEVTAAGLRLYEAHEAGFDHYVEELRDLARWVIARTEAGLNGLPTGIASAPLDPNSTLIFLDAGHDNVTATITWLLWLLAHRADLQQRIRGEWRGRHGSHADPAHLPLTMACVRETLRLYPPTPQILRDVAVDVKIDGLSLARGATVVIPVYAMHRSALWWRDPDAFHPERFLAEGEEGTRAAAWIPFSKGERACFGASFAQMELATFIGMILDRFELEPDPADPIRCEAHWVLRPVAHTPIRLRALGQSALAAA